MRLGETGCAVRCVVWLAFPMYLRGEVTLGNGWLARARRLLEEDGREHVEAGYMLVPRAVQLLHLRTRQPRFRCSRRRLPSRAATRTRSSW
jgi:hypothetical protein